MCSEKIRCHFNVFFMNPPDFKKLLFVDIFLVTTLRNGEKMLLFFPKILGKGGRGNYEVGGHVFYL